MTPSLCLEGVTAGYKRRRVLEDLSLEVPAGSLTALLGPSGCGKTTVLNVIAGLLSPTSGQVRLGRENLTNVAAERRQIGVVFQKPLLFPHLSVSDNVGFGLEMRGVAQSQRRAAADAALRLVQLDSYGDRRVSSLSGGQEQRVALARALVTEPRVLLLDEPLSALDEGLRSDMRALIRSLQRRLGVTTLFVTHDQREAVDIADQVAVMLDGAIAQAGAPRVFYTEPATEQIARFFGWSVLPRSTIGDNLGAGGQPGGAIPAVGARVVAFHPASAHLCTPADGTLSGYVAVPVVVERVLDLGAEIRAIVRLPTGDYIEVTRSRGAGFPSDGTLEVEATHLLVSTASLRFF